MLQLKKEAKERPRSTALTQQSLKLEASAATNLKGFCAARQMDVVMTLGLALDFWTQRKQCLLGYRRKPSQGSPDPRSELLG